MPSQDVSNIHLGNDLASGSALYRDSRSYDIHESEADEIGEHIAGHVAARDTGPQRHQFGSI